MLSEGMTSYVLMTVRAGSPLARAELERQNRRLLEHPRPYDDAYPQRWLYELQWRAAEPPKLSAPGTQARGAGTWLVLTDSGGVGDRLVELFAACGTRCAVAVRSDRFARDADGIWRLREQQPEDWRRLLAEIRRETGAIEGIVHLWSLDGPQGGSTRLQHLAAARARGPVSVLGLVRALCESASPDAPRCWFVTRGAMPVEGRAALDVGQAPLWGCARVLAAEHPRRWGGLTDLEPAAEVPVNALHARLAGELREDQIAFRGAQRLVARLVRCQRDTTAGFGIDPAGSYLITGGLGALG